MHILQIFEKSKELYYIFFNEMSLTTMFICIGFLNLTTLFDTC